MSNQAKYSIVYISPDSRLGDRVAVGMLLFKDHKLIFRFSEDKLKGIRSALGSKAELIKKSLQATQKYIANIDLNKDPIFNEDQHIVSEAYLEKLSIYSNGIIQYQKPRLAILTETFDENKLFESLFPSSPAKGENTKDKNKQIIETDFINVVKENIHVKIGIDHHIIPDFYLNYALDAIGKNGTLYLAQYFDFDKVKDASISHLLVTNESLNKQFNKDKTNKVFIFGTEPELNTDDHRRWDYLYKQEGFLLKHPSESGAVAEEMLRAGVKKFLDV